MRKLSLLLLLVVITMTANAAFISGKYVGNGQSTKVITGMCFRPEVVMITGNSSQHAWVATSTMPAGYAKDLTLSDPLKTGYISSLNADGFTVGNSSHSNQSGVTYYYMAWDDADGSVNVGSFTPNSCGSDWATNTWYGEGTLVKYGSVNYKAKFGVYSNTTPNNDAANWQNAGACSAFNLNISTGFRPKMVWVFSEGTNWDNIAAGQYSFDGPNAANPAGFSSGGWLSGEEKIINGISSTGFSVTPVVQAGTHNGTSNGTKYNYVAFNPSVSASGTYTGTAVNNKQINTIAGQFVIVKPLTNNAGNPWFKTCSMGTDTSYSFAGVNAVLNVKNLNASGFTLGQSGEVNGNGGSYEYFAMSGGACAITSCGPTSYYINDNSLTGNVFTTAVGVDGGSGNGTAAHPYATMAYLLSQKTLVPGDHVYIDAGTYSWSSGITPNGSGTAGSVITIHGAGVAKTVITVTAGLGINSNNKNYITIDGIYLKNSVDKVCSISANSTNWTITNSKLEATNQYALYFTASANCKNHTVSNSTIIGIGGQMAVYAGTGVNNLTFTNNTITSGTTSAYQAATGTSNVTFTNCTISNSSGTLFEIANNTSYYTFTNCTSTAGNGKGLYIASGTASSNIIITGGTITATNDHAIIFGGTISNVSITNLTATSSNNSPLRFAGASTAVTMTNSTFVSNSGGATVFFIDSGSGFNVSGCSFTSNGTGKAMEIALTGTNNFNFNNNCTFTAGTGSVGVYIGVNSSNYQFNSCTITGKNMGLSVQGGSHNYTFTNSTITSTTGSAVRIEGNSYANTFTGCTLTSPNNQAMYLGAPVNNYSITNCTLSANINDAALTIYGSSTGLNIVDNCTITNTGATGAYGIMLRNSGQNSTVSNNTISCTGTQNTKGIYLDNGCANNTIEHNTITLTTNAGAAPNQGISIGTGNNNIIKRNIIKNGDVGIYLGGGGATGIVVDNNHVSNAVQGLFSATASFTGVEVLHNSFYTTRECIYGPYPNWNIRNNIFYTTGNSSYSCMYTLYTYDPAVCNYNLYYHPNGANLARRNSVNYAALSNWKNLFAGNDANSVESNPNYTNAGSNNLIPLYGSAIGRGTYALATDINGAARSSSAPTIGAYEVVNACNIVMSNNATTCAGANTTISVTPSGSSNYTYSWTPTTGLSNPSIANPVANPTATTTYKVTVTGTGGCYNIDSVKITVSQLEWAELNGVTFNCETINKTAVDGYTNGSAFSKNHLNPNQDGWVEFTVGANSNTHEYFGLALKNYSTYNTDIRYGFLLANGTFYVIHKGAKTAIQDAVVGDKLKIERVGSTIKYYKNGSLLSSQDGLTSTERLFIDVSLYYIGHNVKVATSFTNNFDVYPVLNDNNPAAANRDGSIALEPLNEKGAVTYLWNTGATTATLSNVSSGTYSVTATDASGQTTNQSFTLLNKAVWTKLVNMSDIGNSRLTKTTPSGGLEGNGMSKVFLPAGQDGYIEYFATDHGGAPNFHFGFSSLPTNFDIQYYSEQDINYSFLWYGHGSYIREGGQYMLHTETAYGTSTLRIAREGAFIAYYIDGVEKRRVATNPNRDLFLKFQQDGQIDQGIIRTSFGGGITPYYEMVDNNPAATADGSISIEAMGGVAPYTYSWSNGATTANIANLMPGAYTLTINDAGGHTAVKTFKVMNKVVWKNLNGMTLQANDRLKKTAPGYDFTSGWGSSKNYLPAGQDGEIKWETTRTSNNAYVGFSAHPMLFIPDYTHNMINYALCTNSNYFILSEGGRTVYNHGISKNGGSEFKIARVTNPTTHVTEIVYYVDGTEVRRVPTYLNQDLFVVFSQSANGVDLGKMRASFGHELQVSYEPVVDNDPLQTPSGSITVEGIGGKAPYTYLWNTGATTTTINNLAPADYTVTITDANGQTASKTFNVMNKASWTKLHNTEIQSNGFLKMTNGSIDSWAQSVNFIPAGEEGAFEYVSAGPGAIYLGLSQHPFAYYNEMRIADITYGWFSWNYTIAVFQQYFTYNDGLVSQGGNLFRIERKINTTTNQPEIIYYINHLEVARYVVETMDQDLYLKFDMQGGLFGQFRLSHGHQLNASALFTHRNIDVAANGALDVTAFGGKAPYTYQWSNGATTQDLSGLKKGNYTLTITDANGATKTKTFVVKNEISWVNTHNFSVLDGLVNLNGGSGGSYATSKNFLEAGQDGKVEFELTKGGSGYFGLTTSSSISNYTDIKYGFFQWHVYLGLTHNSIYEGYVQPPVPHGSYYHNGDIFSIERVGTTLYYRVNNILITQRTVSANERLYVAIHNPDAAVRTLSVLCNFGAGIQTITLQESYARLQRKLNSKNVIAKNNELLFVYDEEYELKEGEGLQYAVYDNNNALQLNNVEYAISIKRGLNKITIPCLYDKVGGSGTYILEITNTKNEKWYLRFEVGANAACN